MKPRNQQARCVRCGYVAPLRAFEVEVALSADDSGDNDWVINFSCPACEAAERPALLPTRVAETAGAASAATSTGPSDHERTLRGQTANPMYDPLAP